MSGNRLLRSSAIFSAMTFLSRLSGLVRDQVYAYVFGATAAMDVFFVAFRIPNFMRRLSAEGSFSMAFVPVLAEYKEKHSPEAVRELIDRVTGTLTAALLVVTAVVLLLAPQLAFLIASKYTGAHHDMLTEMLRITFPYALFISLASLVGSILNSYQRFAIPALSPILLNLSMIAAAWLAYVSGASVMMLAWGVFVAGILQLVFQLPALAKLGLLPRPKLGLAHAGVRKIMKLMVPTLFGSSVVQFNLLFNTWAAAFLLSGSVSWLYYSDRLLEFPLGMFGVAIGTVILPHLSSRHAATDPEGFSKGLDWGVPAVPADRRAGLHWPGPVRGPADGDAVPVPQVHRLPRPDEQLEPDGAVHRGTGVPAGQGAGTGFLLAAGHPHAGEGGGGVGAGECDRDDPVVRRPAAVHRRRPGRAGQGRRQIPGRAGAHSRRARGVGCDRRRRLDQRRAAGLVPAPGRGRTAASPAWGRVPCATIGLASLAMTAVLIALRWVWPDWSHWAWWERGWRLAVLVGSGGALYAALLWLQGIRPRDLRGH